MVNEMTSEPAAAAEPAASEPAAVTAVSIILVTRNRAAHLKQTLEAISKLSVPPGFQVELVVVDNASTDETAQIVSSVEMGAITLTYLYEAKPGKLTACNSALAVAKGDILVWTDDDVVPPQDWIASLCLPILRGEAAGVVGKVKTAPHLERDWMTPVHYGRLSDTRFMEDYACLIGANMAFHRDVLQKVPEFDPELGPGKLGFMDDTLFSFRLWAAGYKTVVLPQVTVEHHFDPDRLLRKSWLRNGESSGRSHAYVHYHWYHRSVKVPVLQLLVWSLALKAFRLLHPPNNLNSEGCHPREIRLVEAISFLKQYLVERRRPRKYQKQTD